MSMRCLNINLFSTWNIVFVIIGLYKDITITNGLKYIHVPQWHNVISTEPKAPNTQKSQSRNSHSSSLAFTELGLSPRLFSTSKDSVSSVFCFFTEYQSQVEKRSGKCTQNKLDNYIKKEDPNLGSYYHDPNFSRSTSIWLPNSITFCQDYFSV